MKKIATLIAALALPLAGCGGGAPETAEEAHEQRADALEEAAEVSTPEGADQLENLAEQHEQAAQWAGDSPADPTAVDAPIPDNVSVGDTPR